MFFYSFRAFTEKAWLRYLWQNAFMNELPGGRKEAVLQKPPFWDSIRWEFFLLKRSKLLNQKSHIDAFKNDYKSKGYHLKYQQQLLLCKIPPILQLMNFCQTSSVFSDPLDLLDHPLLLDIFFLGAPQLRAGVGFLFFYKMSFEKHPNQQPSIFWTLRFINVKNMSMWEKNLHAPKLWKKNTGSTLN